MYNPSSMRIENILDECVTAIHERGETMADCLARYPAYREELESLLRLAVRLQAAQTLQASPEFRHLSTIRVGNLVAARQRQRPVTAPSLLDRVWRGWQAVLGASGRLAGVTAVSVALVVSLLVGGGVVYAAADDLPGDALYPVKRAVERAQLALSPDDAGLRLSFAVRRLDEVATLLGKGQPQEIDQALVDYDAHMASIVAFLSEDGMLSPDEQIALAGQLIEVQARQEAQFAILLGQAPPGARAAIELTLATSRTVRDRALQVLGEQPGRPENSPETPEHTWTAIPPARPKPPTSRPALTSSPRPSPPPRPTRPSARTPSSPPSLTPSPPPEPTDWPTPTPKPTLPPSLTPTPGHTATPQPTLPPPSLTPTPHQAPPTPKRTPSPQSTPPPTPERTPSAAPTSPPPEWTPPSKPASSFL
jgi:hypothetical protein